MSITDYHRIIDENGRRSIVEFGLCGDDVIEVFLKRHHVVVRIIDDSERPNGYFIAVEPYECEQCEEERKMEESALDE